MFSLAVLAQRILCRLGPKARISNKQKPLNVLKNVKAAEGPSILMEMLKGMKEAVVGEEKNTVSLSLSPS